MSLATRCPACATTFRVVQDQLKISGGWVRCGQCHQVFNGLEALIELGDGPPAAPPSAAAPPPAPAPAVGRAAAVPARTDVPQTPDLSDPDPEDDDAALAGRVAERPDRDPPPDASPPQPTAVPDAPAVPEPEPEPSRIPTGEVAGELSRWPEPPVAAGPVAATPGGVDLTGHQPDEPDEDAFDPVVSVPPFAHSRLAASGPQTRFPEPSAPDDGDDVPGTLRPRPRKPGFMRRAEQAAQWRRPAMRAVLGSTAALLGVMLALQVLHQERDLIAARWPVARAPLEGWCQLARCTLAPPRALARLTLDSTSLQRTGRPGELRFEADLHNAAEHAVRAPALDLSFQDLQGRTLVRKVLLAEQLEAPASGLAPDGSWHLSARLQVGELRITGFAAEIFYP